MPDLVLIRNDSYFDSVLLMRISRELSSLPGIEDAVVAMATPQNKSLLADSHYASPELGAAGPNDLVIAVRGEGGAVGPGDVELAIGRLLKADRSEDADAEAPPRSLAAALHSLPEANFALISVPGQYAAREARAALRRGLHVMVFSDNVSVGDEVALKTEAVARGLLMMGPDCGTAIINGKPLAFANVVRRGPVGVVGASGTGIQEVTCCIHRLGGGISQAIGTGGRDLSDKVGGLMTLAGIGALAADPATRVIVVVSKPPSPAVATKVVAALAGTGKPAVVHFVGRFAEEMDACAGVTFADSLAGTAEVACRLAGPGDAAPHSVILLPAPSHQGELTARAVAARQAPGVRLRGLFCGGTTGQEAVALLGHHGIEVFSNLHKSGPLHADGLAPVAGHLVLDLGADEFTVGRPHPMIDPLLRNEHLRRAMDDPAVGLLLFDCVLGYGSHPDPAGVLADGVRTARNSARRRGSEIVAVASLTGTPDDPQGFDTQWRKLVDAGVCVAANNCEAVGVVAEMLKPTAKESAR